MAVTRLLFLLSLLSALTLALNPYKDADFGLCVNNSGAACSPRTQRYGVCCEGTNQYFINVCQACLNGCQIWRYARKGDVTCSY